MALLAMAEGLLSRQSPPYTQLDSALCVVGQVRCYEAMYPTGISTTKSAWAMCACQISQCGVGCTKQGTKCV